MPQMMPLSWLMLFSMFSITLIVFSAMNYYTTTPTMSVSGKKSIPAKTLNWKW
uniref:ATP synthase complex subunit 8 n=1 Tax=Cryptotermes kirbyi TaxID=2942687 RepID=A0A8X8RHE8_9NEOP|nr:ATP synthase F0 subunit 8 [Cryptotermes kirbyi]URX53905.1 ATP synthase F0 subunit 8 [Cryptotermes kirbyi]